VSKRIVDKLPELQPAITTVAEIVRPKIAQSSKSMNRLKRAIEALPKQSVFEALRLQFSKIERLHKQTASLVHGISSTYSPAEMMQVRAEIYVLTENLKLLVEAVEQAMTNVEMQI
jgi:hypothetical protein